MQACTILILFLIILMIYQWIHIANLKTSTRKGQAKTVSIIKKNQELLHRLYLSSIQLKKQELPEQLENIACSEEAGIVISSKQIKIPLEGPTYNGAICRYNENYGLFFRYDVKNIESHRGAQHSYVGFIPLDENFEPLSHQCTMINTDSNHSEDARFFQNKGQSYLIYNDFEKTYPHRRSIRIGTLDFNENSLKSITSLNINLKKTEKNWTPVSHNGNIYFIHTISPQKTLLLENPSKNSLKVCFDSKCKSLKWSLKWGIPRGGTPALEVDGQYLSFFHSSFEDRKGIVWYVMGAYTFSKNAPFQIERISPYPIIFKEAYTHPHHKDANPRIRSLFPTGFIQITKSTRSSLFVSCGANDSGVKILELDQNSLLNSLENIY